MKRGEFLRNLLGIALVPKTFSELRAVTPKKELPKFEHTTFKDQERMEAWIKGKPMTVKTLDFNTNEVVVDGEIIPTRREARLVVSGDLIEYYPKKIVQVQVVGGGSNFKGEFIVTEVNICVDGLLHEYESVLTQVGKLTFI